MASVDLVNLLARAGRAGVDGFHVYGRVSEVITRPDFIAEDIVFHGSVIVVDVFALSNSDASVMFGPFTSDGSNNGTFLSSGQILCCTEVDDPWSLIGKFVKASKPGGRGMKVKAQGGVYNRPDNIAGFVFQKDVARNGWKIVGNDLVETSANPFKDPALGMYWEQSKAEGKIVHPEEVKQFPEYSQTRVVAMKRPGKVAEEVTGVKSPLSFKTGEEYGSSERYSPEYIEPPEDPNAPPPPPVQLVHRLESVPVSPMLPGYLEEIGGMKKKRMDLAIAWYDSVMMLEDFTATAGMERFFRAYETEIIKNFSMPVGNSKMRGAVYLEKLVDYLLIFDEKDNSQKELMTLLQYSPGEMDRQLPDPYLRFTMEMCSIIGVSCKKVSDAFDQLYKLLGMPSNYAMYALFNNPHKFGVITGGLSFEECDKFEFASEAYHSRYNLVPLDREGSALWANINRLMHIFEDSNGHTSLATRELQAEYKNSRLLSSYYATNTPFTAKEVSVVRHMLGQIPTAREKRYNVTKDIARRSTQVNALLYSEEIGLMTSFSATPEGVPTGPWSLTSYVEKETEIYSILHSMSERNVPITDEQVAEGIRRYEAEAGFPLEQLQKDGINLTKFHAGVLSGCAGSGKTTTSKCIVGVLEAGLPGWNVQFAAPTGKAARRLSEVVGGTVKTLHSMFHLGIGKSSMFLDGQEPVKPAEDYTVYIFDEMAMCNIDLLHSVVTRLPFNSIVYFLGDIKQLPPIGKGLPFQSMMEFLPTVELGVSKRAAEGSGINYNCDVINQHSERGNFKPLKTADDFHMIASDEVGLQAKIAQVVRDVLTRYRPEDVQVITPYQTNKKPWGTSNLNPLLEPEFCQGEVLFNYWDDAYRVGERVIHVKRNCYDFRRYLRDGNHFTEVETHGVVNGEMGTLVGVVRSEECSFDTIERDENFRELRDDEKAINERMYFALFCTFDVDMGQDVYIMYHMKKNGSPHDGARGADLQLIAGDWVNIELAYALTVHKMQGSQSPVVIIPVGPKDDSSFYNRNMIYTAISRASKEVYLVGSVGPGPSNLDNIRRSKVKDVKTSLDPLVKA